MRGLRRSFASRAWAGWLLAALLAACAVLPRDVPRPVSYAFTDTAATPLGTVVGAGVAAHPGRNAVHAMPVGREAFAARLLLARSARRSIDAQYYIWHPDTSGALLARELWDAAERGVRVRLLLDDVNTKGLDPQLATLDAHPGIEVRLFNPFANRSWRVGDYAGDFSRVNRRMHNKSFIADGQAAVIGGRNIGDEYLGVEGTVAFADLDVMTAGPVVQDISAEFDRYWNSASAYPVAAILPPPSPEMLAQVHSQWDRSRESPQALRYLAAVRDTDLVSHFLAGTLPVEWVPARVVADDPDKVLQPTERTDLQMLPLLQAALGRPQSELLLVSPYFVPAKAGTQALLALAQRGVRVQILTNSLAATDVAPVYAGYVHYREELLRGGIRLFELKPAAAPLEPQKRERSGPGGSGSGGSSSASLHAKTFAVDRQRIFVGSFNLDPRSARLNTEMGVVLESPELASRLAAAFDEEVPRNAYEVRIAADGRSLEWIERTPDGEVRHDSTPETGPLRTLWVGFLSLLPIEWLL